MAGRVNGHPRAYHVQVVGHARIARHQGKEPASLVVAVNSSSGPVTGLRSENFRVHAGPVAPGGCLVDVTRVVSNFPGRYLLDIVPFYRQPGVRRALRALRHGGRGLKRDALGRRRRGPNHPEPVGSTRK
jgi:hypothetical protein